MVASNMDTVGTFDMAQSMAKHQLFTTIHKHYRVDEWINFVENIEGDKNVHYISHHFCFFFLFFFSKLYKVHFSSFFFFDAHFISGNF